MDSSGCDSLRLLAGDGNHVRLAIGADLTGRHGCDGRRVANQFCDSARLAGHQRHLRATPGLTDVSGEKPAVPVGVHTGTCADAHALITVYEDTCPIGSTCTLIGDRYLSWGSMDQVLHFVIVFAVASFLGFGVVWAVRWIVARRTK